MGEPIRIELGGGTRNRGPGWINVDQCPEADIRCNLDVTPWPIADASVDELYTAHCIEHVTCPISFVREIARVCRVGATVEIRCPDATSEMAMVAGHKSVVSVNFIRHMDSVFPDMFWSGGPRRLRLVRTDIGPDDYWFPLARSNPIFSGWTDNDILNWIPRTRHENRFHFEVVPCTL